MPSLRGSVTSFERDQGKDVAVVVVRAGSKMGAALTARLTSMQLIPFREQEVVSMKNLSNDRFLDKWEVRVKDSESLRNIGR